MPSNGTAEYSICFTPNYNFGNVWFFPDAAGLPGVSATIRRLTIC